MECFQQGSDIFFRISPAEVESVKAFALRRGEVEGRLDTWFNHPRYGLLSSRLDKATAPTPRLGELLLSISSGATPKLSDSSLYTESGIKLLRILNVEDGEILKKDLKYITDDVHEGQLKRSQLADDDVLMTITGRVGSAAVVHDEYLPANINQHLVRMRIDTELCRPEFLSEWLNSPAGLELSNRYVSGGTRAALDYDAIRQIRVPLPDSLRDQDNLLFAMDAARAVRDAKQADADSLLADISDFVLDALGIESPTTNPFKVFAVVPADIRKGGSLNSDYYHPERMLALRALEYTSDRLTTTSLGDVVSFEREQIKTPGKNYLGLAHIQSDTGELTDSEDTVKGTCFIYQTGDVLFARLRPYLNKVYHAEMDGCCSTEFHILRARDRGSLSPDYLAAILRTRIVLAQTKHMMTGNTHPRLTNDDVANLRIPIPRIEVQESIAAEVRRRREEARRLRSEAESSWQDAKRWFEEQLLR